MEKKPQKLIFLVDDNQHLLDSFSFLINNEGYLTETSRDPKEAIQRIECGLIYDLLIVDRAMEGMEDGGDEVARISKITNPFVPVMAISAFEDKYNRKCFDHYLRKPFNVDLMIDHINHVFE